MSDHSKTSHEGRQTLGEALPEASESSDLVSVGDGLSKSDLEEFLEATGVLIDAEETRILRRIFYLSQEIAAPLWEAQRETDPKRLKSYWRDIQNCLKLEMALVSELDEYRNGDLPGTNALDAWQDAEKSAMTVEVASLKRSDAYLSQRIQIVIDSLENLASQIDREVARLRGSPRVAFQQNGFIQEDTSYSAQWERELVDLSDRPLSVRALAALAIKMHTYVSEHGAKLRRRDRARHHIHNLIIRAQKKISSKSSTASSAISAGETGAEGRLSKFAIAPSIQKARRSK